MENLPLKNFIKVALWVQGITVLATGVVSIFFGSWHGAWSAGAGGFSVFLAQGLLFMRVLSTPSDDPVRFASRFYSSEALKLLVAGGLLALSLYLGALPLFAFIGFSATILSNWLVPIFVKKEVPGHVN